MKIPDKIILVSLLVLIVFSTGCQQVSDQYIQVDELKEGLHAIATALAALMIAYQGIQWILSTQPEEREECKKAIIYILFALIVVSLAGNLVDALYCSYCGGCCSGPTVV